MRRWIFAAALLALAACSKEKEIDPPAELTEFEATIDVDRLWTASVGGDAEVLRLGLALSVEGDRVYAAGRSGDVAAFDLASGRTLWRTRTRAPLAGGTGVGSGMVAVGSSEGEVIVLDAADGSIRWRVQLNGEILAAPAVSSRAIVVRTVDGKLRGLSVEDGRELWTYEQPVPRLTLRGTSRPVIAGNMAICGFDNGKVVALNLVDGASIWETLVAQSRGRTELERLVDIDSAVRVVGDDIYVVGFHGRVALLARETGQIWWSQETSSYRGLAVDDEAVYIATERGEVVALRRRTGTEIWRQEALLHRGLSAPAVGADAVVVADFEGYVHWLDKATGALAARSSAGGARVSNPPVVVGDRVLVINDAGRITAFRQRSLQRSVAEASPERPAAERGAQKTAGDGGDR